MESVPVDPMAIDGGAAADTLETLVPAPPVARAEVDTSAPFVSVREAVDRFGGSALWKPQHKALSPSEENICFEQVDAAEVEQQAILLEKDLIAKERETLEVLKELEMTKRIVLCLKLRLQKESHGITVNAYNTEVHPLTEQGQTNNPESQVNPAVPAVVKQDPELILVELRKAKLNLNRTTNDISGMRAYIDLLGGNIAKEKTLLGMTREKLSANKAETLFLEENLNESTLKLQEIRYAEGTSHADPLFISSQNEELRAKMKVSEEAKDDALKLTIVKNTAELYPAAKKTEDSYSEIKALSENEKAADLSSLSGVTLPIETYLMLKCKAQEAEEMCRKKIEAAMHEVDEANRCKQVLLTKVEEATAEVKTSRKTLEEALHRVETATKAKLVVEEALRKWRSEHGQKHRSVHNSTRFKNAYSSQQRKDSSRMLGSDSPRDSLRPPMSIGQILSMKLTCPEYDAKVKAKTNDTGALSLAQVLRKSHRVLSPGRTEDGSNHRRYSTKRRKLGFMALSVLLPKQDKNKKKMRMHACGS